jgi:hypothetical protein
VALGAALAVALPAAAAMLVMGPQLAGGDSGQWVMLARAYLGLPIPAYRDPFAVPPAAPLLVLGLWQITGDPYLAPKLALVVAFALVPLAAFLLGRELYGWLPGLAAALIVGVGQHFYLRLAVFGALPQLLSLAAFGLALAAAARWARGPSLPRGPAIALACLGIVASHAPTAAVALPVLGLVLLLLPYSGPRAPPRGVWRSAAARAWPVLPALGAFTAYAWLKRGTFQQYLGNEAAYYLKGLGSALGELLRLRTTSLLLWAGGGVLLVLVLRGAFAARALRRGAPARPPRSPLVRALVPEPNERRRAALVAAVLGVPALALGALMLAFHVARVGTDYPRLFPLIGFPGLVSLAAVVPAMRWRDLASWLPSREARALGLAGLLLVPTMAAVVATEERAMAFYSVRAPGDLEDAMRAVERTVPEDAVVWTPVREGKWMEGITGRPALFALPAWAIFRPWEWERKEAAETLGHASAWATSGLVGAATQRDPGVLTDNPVVSVYYKGDLRPVLRLDDRASRVRVLLPGSTEASLAALPERGEQLRMDGAQATVDQRAAGQLWTWRGQPVRVEVQRLVSVEAGAGAVLLTVHVRVQGAQLESVSLALRPPHGGAWAVRADQGDALGLELRRQAEPLALRVSAGPSGMATLYPTGSGVDARMTVVDGPGGPRSEAHATLTMVGDPVGQPKPGLRALTAAQALDAYDVRYALLPRSGADTERAAASSLGFHPAYENRSYTLYQRGDAA